MTFFQDQTVLDIMSSHINQVEKLEKSEARSVLKLYKDVRRELRDRLDFIPGDTFTAQQLRGTLIQIESAILTMNSDLGNSLSSSSQNLAVLGVNHLVKEATKFEKHFTGAIVPINLDAVILGAESANRLFNQKEASIKAYSEGIRSGLTRLLTQASIAQEPTGKVVTRLSKFFLTEEWRLLRIVRTELHNVYNLSKMDSMANVKAEYMPDLKKTLIHPMDHRTGEDSKALAEDNQIVQIDKPFRQVYNGKTRVYMNPPDRPNDRAVLVPIRDSWNK